MSQPSTLFELKNIQLSCKQQIILRDISFSINAGQIMSIVGPNGAGKTSLIRLILGFEKPSAGEFLAAAGLKISYMPQKFIVNEHLPLSVRQFLSLKVQHLDTDILQRLKIDSRLDTPLQSSSGGELQRILLARALMQQPQLLILDEPTQGVDLHGQAELYEIIEEYRQRLGCAILMVSHDLHVVMAKTDLVICLNQHICCHGHPQEVSQHPAYIELFGDAHADTLAVYNHQHDHHHDLDGAAHVGTCSHHKDS